MTTIINGFYVNKIENSEESCYHKIYLTDVDKNVNLTDFFKEQTLRLYPVNNGWYNHSSFLLTKDSIISKYKKEELSNLYLVSYAAMPRNWSFSRHNGPIERYLESFLSNSQEEALDIAEKKALLRYPSTYHNDYLYVNTCTSHIKAILRIR